MTAESLHHLLRETLDDYAIGLIVFDADQSVSLASDAVGGLWGLTTTELAQMSFTSLNLLGDEALTRQLWQAIKDNVDDPLHFHVPVSDALFTVRLRGIVSNGGTFLGGFLTIREYPLASEIENLLREMHHALLQVLKRATSGLESLRDVMIAGKEGVAADELMGLLGDSIADIQLTRDAMRHVHSMVRPSGKSHRVSLRRTDLSLLVDVLLVLMNEVQEERGLNFKHRASDEAFRVHADPAMASLVGFVALHYLSKLTPSLGTIEVSYSSTHEVATVELRSEVDELPADDPFSPVYTTDDGIAINPSRLVLLRTIMRLQGGELRYETEGDSLGLLLDFPLRKEASSSSYHVSLTNSGSITLPDRLLVVRSTSAPAFPEETLLLEDHIISIPIDTVDGLRRSLHAESRPVGVLVNILQHDVDLDGIIQRLLSDSWAEGVPLILKATDSTGSGEQFLAHRLYPAPVPYATVLRDLGNLCGPVETDGDALAIIASLTTPLCETLDLMLSNEGYTVLIVSSIEELVNRSLVEEQPTAVIIDGVLLDKTNRDMLRVGLEDAFEDRKPAIFLVNVCNPEEQRQIIALDALSLSNREHDAAASCELIRAKIGSPLQ